MFQEKSSSRMKGTLVGVCLLWLLLACAPVGASPNEAAPLEAGEDDGPYAFYSGEAQLQLYWMCGGEMVERTQALATPIPVECGFPAPIVAREPAVVRPQVRFEASRIAALSDIHGQFDVFVELLRNNRIIDDAMDWTFGDGHLVIAGDIFDRGGKQTEVLWLLYQLEQQAAEQGGMVHTLLGNHETMVLYDDLRYLHPKYSTVAESLNRRFPELYGEDTVLGAWLRARPVIVAVNGILFMHAGLHPDYLELGLSVAEVNDRYRESLGIPRKTLMETPVLDFLYGSIGPLWYRGYFRDQESPTSRQLDALTAAMDVERIVVGHTSFAGIHQHWEGRVINIDSSIKRGERGEILLWEGGQFSVGDQSGRRTDVPRWTEEIPESPRSL